MKQFIQKYGKWLILICLIIVIKAFSLNSSWVEKYYRNGIYPYFSMFLRVVFGWIPFSIGDILYGSAVIWVIVKVVKGIVSLVKRKVNGRSFVVGLAKTLFICLSIYIIFNAFWGINYNRKGIATQLNLSSDTFSLAELKNINQLLVNKVNASKSAMLESKAVYPNNKELFAKVAQAYVEAEKIYPYLSYHPVSLKSSMWGWLGNYTGFTGYYNPFSGEAQVNTSVPRFVLPFTCCHEVAHQLGYAKENEANFVGYLAATASKDPYFLYSVYLDLFQYANRTLAFNSFLVGDTITAPAYRKQLLPAINADLKELRAFQQRHHNPFEPVIRKGYAFYLRRNEQPKGIRSYDEVTSFMMAYYRKFGRI